MRRLHQNVRKTVAMLLVVCFLFSMTGCFSQPDVEYDTRLNFLSNMGKSVFRVVYPRDNCAEGVYQAACAVQTALEQTLGVKVDLVSDMGAELAPDLVMPYEILVGNTARKETREVGAALAQDEWLVRLQGHKIVLLGQTNRATVEAVDHFLKSVVGVSEQGEPISNPQLKIELEYTYRGQYDVPPVANLLNGVTFDRAPYLATVVYPVSVPEDRAQALSIATLQGLAAINGSEQILWRDSAYTACLPYLLEDTDLIVEETDDRGEPWTFVTLLQRYSPMLDGYILCSSDMASESACVAVTLAHQLNAVVVTPENEPVAIESGLMCLLDVSDKDDQWLRQSSYFADVNTSVAVEQSALSAPALLDYAVMTGGYCYSDQQDVSELVQTLEFLQPGATVLFGTDRDQMDALASQSDLALQAINAGYVLNLSTYSGYAPSLSLSRPADGDAVLSDERHTVCFLLVDSRDFRSTLDAYTVDPGFYASSLRGELELSWSVPSAMFDLAPQVLSLIEATATEQDDFVMPLSLPQHADSADWHVTARQFIATSASNAMRRMGIRYLQLPGALEDEMYETLLKQSGVDGLICLDATDENGEPATFRRVMDKVVVSTRYHLTAQQTDVSLTGIALALNTAETDVTSAQAYSLIVIDADVGLDKNYQVVQGGDTLALVKALSERLADTVDVVSVSDFMERMAQNVK